MDRKNEVEWKAPSLNYEWRILCILHAFSFINTHIKGEANWTYITYISVAGQVVFQGAVFLVAAAWCVGCGSLSFVFFAWFFGLPGSSVSCLGVCWSEGHGNGLRSTVKSACREKSEKKRGHSDDLVKLPPRTRASLFSWWLLCCVVFLLWCSAGLAPDLMQSKEMQSYEMQGWDMQS